MKNPMIAKFRILEKEAYIGCVFVEPDKVCEGESLSVRNRTLRIYGDLTGKWKMPPEWKKEGATVYGFGGGPGRNAYIDYGYFLGKREEPQLLHDDPDFIWIHSLPRTQPPTQLTS